MTHTRIHLASLVAITYVAVVLGGTLIHFVNTGDAYTLRFSLTQPTTWVASIVGAVVAWGLWQHFAWAWWLGIGAAVVQLFRVGTWVVEHYSSSRSPSIGVSLVVALLLAFLALLLPSKVRASCSR
jgi:benzodiazapine receptor